MIDRRALLGALAASALPASARAGGVPDALGGRLDAEAAAAGGAIDAALARRFPAGSPGKSPYRVTARTGAWSAAHPSATAIDRDTALLAADQRADVVLPRAALDRTIDALGVAATKQPTEIATAIDRQRTLLMRQRTAAPRLPGLGHLRDGAALYALYLQRPCGAVTPADAWARLTHERDALLARADRLFARIGQHRGSVGDRYRALWADPAGLYHDSDAGRAAAIADMNRLTSAARAAIPTLFGTVPPFCLDVAARALSASEIAAGRQGYREVPAPGRPGAYVVDLIDIRRRPRWTLPSVVAHELLPGHMLQLGIEAQTPPAPRRLDHAAAFVEGWGIYAETLAPYPDPRDELGHVHWLLFRVGRAIVDIALHLHGWSPERARAALVAWQGEPAYFASFATELDRIALEPGVRAGEALAWLAIADATRGLTGPTLIEHHRAILAGGRKRTETIREIAA